MIKKELRKKLDARGRRALDREELPEQVEVMVRTEREPTDEEKEALDGAGFRVYYATGNVVTGRVATAQLEGVAELPFVGRIEVSRPLYEEDTDERR